jgi:hypothetical protein
MEKFFYSPTTKDLKLTAFQLANCNSIPHPFSVEKNSAGSKWFLKKHSELSLRKTQPLSIAGINGFTRENGAKFFPVLKSELERIKYLASALVNAYRAGVMIVEHRSQ